MSFETVRAAVAAYVNTGWIAAATGAPLEFDNINLIDHDARSTPFVTFRLKYRDSRQASLENVPTTRYDGEAEFHIHVPQGSGTAPAMALADALAGFMQYAKVSNVQFLTPRLLASSPYKGWEITPLCFSFFYRE